ncbi:rod shape-determining protein MreC [Salinisphaera japonica]|uniref:Cell shape-determining protein MreC n=1 Tax=Salinisphaera japonica YTM-1 TaxID=1209778 RepID=A0A423PP82_9GAMM|nr:rod shape-determining protein MreC [Salinisphaera japonica]ROO27436.1 rod shape-determining protein MreC [Salinisphaera japonica YTM-1]
MKIEDDNNNHALTRRIAPGLGIVMIAIISIGLMIVDDAGEKLSPVRDVLSVMAQPIEMAAEWPGQTLTTLDRYFDRGALLRENERLRQNNLLLQGRLQRLAALEAENERIRALLASASVLDQNVLIARIMSVSPDPYRQYVKLNKGSTDGVFVGQALIDAHGIMGQVTDVTPLGSRAILISDPNNGVPVEINRTGLQTIAQGTGHAETLTLPFLPNNADVEVGDLLVSSGLGGRYPADYPVAKITSVRHRPGGEFLDVDAAPTAELERGREALLIWSTPEPAEDIASSEETSSPDDGSAEENDDAEADRP